jgi:hypothetical protein
MRNLMTTVASLALLSGQVAVAQTAVRPSAASESPIAAPSLAGELRLVDTAPIGHRQPHARDVPLESASNLQQPSAEDAKVDRKLTICRGC